MAQAPSYTFERTGYFILSCAVLTYVTARAVFVPLIHDESVTFFIYLSTGAFQPGYAHWDAGNHLLNTALSYVGYHLFGMAPLALRMFSVLAFILYAWYTWRIGRSVNNVVVRSILYGSLLLAPILLEFFSLFRGYGLMMGFMMMGLFHLLHFASSFKPMHGVGALFGWMCAGCASLTVLMLWAMVLGLLLFFGVRGHRSWRHRSLAFAIWLLVGLAPFLYCTWYALELSERDMLYAGSSHGLFNGTLVSLCELMLGDRSLLLRSFICVALLGAVSLAVVRLARCREPALSDPLTILSVLLIGELVGHWGLSAFAGVLSPTERTAMHLVILTLLVVITGLDKVVERVPSLRWSALILLVLPLRTILSANLHHATIWPNEAIDTRMFHAVEERQKRAKRPLLISAYDQLPASWEYEHLRSYPEIPPLGTVKFPEANADLLLMDTILVAPPVGFHEVVTSRSGRLSLFERNTELRTRLVADSTVQPSANTTNESFPILRGQGPPWSEHATLVEITAVMSFDRHPPCVRFVAEHSTPNGPDGSYETLELERWHLAWNNDTLRTVRHFPKFLTAEDVANVYIWNIDKMPMSVSSCRIRIFQILE
jgi:hypothetical protein